MHRRKLFCITRVWLLSRPLKFVFRIRPLILIEGCRYLLGLKREEVQASFWPIFWKNVVWRKSTKGLHQIVARVKDKCGIAQNNMLKKPAQHSTMIHNLFRVGLNGEAIFQGVWLFGYLRPDKLSKARPSITLNYLCLACPVGDSDIGWHLILGPSKCVSGLD